MNRPDWNEYFLGICQAVLARADCVRAQHGAVITKHNRIVSTGYNGGPSGGPSCLKGECPRGQLSYEQLGGFEKGNHDYSNCISLHAETNAIAYANRHDTQGGTIYIDAAPCDMCLKLIRAAGIVRVVYGMPDSYQVMEL